MTNPTPNTDETDEPFIGNFHKSIPHDSYGEVIPEHYEKFRDTCRDIDAGLPLDFEAIAAGSCKGGYEADGFVSPLAGASSETHGPDPSELEMLPAPGIKSASTAAEMVELYWMALLRDLSFCEYEAGHPRVTQAVSDIAAAYQQALAQDDSPGAVRLGLDLPVDRNTGALDIRRETLFGCGLTGEDQGPWISQFFLQEIPYGVQAIDTRQFPYAAGRDFLTDFDDWLCAQNTASDHYGRGYGNCNYYFDDPGYYAPNRRFISTFRDMARFVNRDALHQSYFNAALLLDAIGAPLDSGNPYGQRYTREGGFATLGGPDLLTLVSEVASRALKVVWRQKWLVHRRCRPEVYGGLLHVQEIGNSNGDQKPYGIGDIVIDSSGAREVLSSCGGYLLPMAFSAGSPNHPAYGAGHATVAGACTTVLKAWFDESRDLGALLQAANAEPKEPGQPRQLLKPGCRQGEELEMFDDPQPCQDNLTVGGELNKLASNVSMGRSIGGVHWRSDNTRSLRLGERIAIDILRKRTHEYAEAGVSFSFESFDGDRVTI